MTPLEWAIVTLAFILAAARLLTAIVDCWEWRMGGAS